MDIVRAVREQIEEVREKLCDALLASYHLRLDIDCEIDEMAKAIEKLESEYKRYDSYRVDMYGNGYSSFSISVYILKDWKKTIDQLLDGKDCKNSAFKALLTEGFEKIVSSLIEERKKETKNKK